MECVKPCGCTDCIAENNKYKHIIVQEYRSTYDKSCYWNTVEEA